jgi:hypothetical protein
LGRPFGAVSVAARVKLGACVHVAARTRVSSARPRPSCAVSLFSLLGMGKNSNVTKRKTFHDADLAAEKEQDAKRAEKRKKTQAKLLAKVMAGPAVVPTPMDEERVTGKLKKTKAAASSKKPLRAKGPLQGVKKKKNKESKIHNRQLIRAAKGRVRAAKPCPVV